MAFSPLLKCSTLRHSIAKLYHGLAAPETGEKKQINRRLGQQPTRGCASQKSWPPKKAIERQDYPVNLEVHKNSSKWMCNCS